MSEDIKLTKLASCAGCGAKVGAGTLVKLLQDLPVLQDERLIVGYDKSDDASVYQLDENTAIVQTLDFFPPIVDDPRLFGQIAACNAFSDVYAMGGEPKLALNIMTVSKEMSQDDVHEILRGGYEKAAEAGAIIAGGHTIEDVEPKYGLSVTGFVHPKRVLTNAGAQVGDQLILTKPLGVGILTTAAKADLVDHALLEKLYRQMATLNRGARDCMVQFEIHSCTDVTGFGLLGHGYEMAAGSEKTIHIRMDSIPYHKEAYEMADMGFVPAGAYRNRTYAEAHVRFEKETPLPLQDILFDPQTSGGLLIAVAQSDAEALLEMLLEKSVEAAIIGYVAEEEDVAIVIE